MPDKFQYGEAPPENPLWAGSEELGITQEDINPEGPIANDAWADPMRQEGSSVDPNFSITYGDEKFNKDLEAIYSSELNPSHEVRKFLNEQTDENERFGHEIVFNTDHYPVHAGIRKPTKLEWTEMPEKDRTKTRRDYFMQSKEAVENISRSVSELTKFSFGDTIRLLATDAVGNYKKLLKTPEPVQIEDLAMIQPQEQKLAATIAQVEGTDRKAKKKGYTSGYDVTLGYGKFDPKWFNSKEKNLTDLTVGEVLTLQKDMLNHPKNNLNSSAVGKWQLTRRTLKDLLDRKVIDADLTDKFTPELQDRIFYALLNKRGYSKFKQGELSKENFLKGLKNEWEGLSRFRSDIEDLLETGEDTA